MSMVTVSSKGQIVLPAELRRRLGLGAGARIEVVEETDGLKLRVVRPVASAADVAGLAGLVKAPRAAFLGAWRNSTRRRHFRASRPLYLICLPLNPLASSRP